MKIIFKTLLLTFLVLCAPQAYAQAPYTIYDDKALLEAYAKKYYEEPKDILLEIIQDDTLTSYKIAAAVRVLNKHYNAEIVGKEKAAIERILLRRLSKTNSPFVEIEVMHLLCLMDRYKYFPSMVPALILKLDHYNRTINEICYSGLKDIIQKGASRPREARIVFNVLRKILFLSRKKLSTIKEPGQRLKQKLDLLRWSIKVLGTEELKRLPPEVINLL